MLIDGWTKTVRSYEINVIRFLSPPGPFSSDVQDSFYLVSMHRYTYKTSCDDEKTARMRATYQKIRRHLCRKKIACMSQFTTADEKCLGRKGRDLFFFIVLISKTFGIVNKKGGLLEHSSSWIYLDHFMMGGAAPHSKTNLIKAGLLVRSNDRVSHKNCKCRSFRSSSSSGDHDNDGMAGWTAIIRSAREEWKGGNLCVLAAAWMRAVTLHTVLLWSRNIFEQRMC